MFCVIATTIERCKTEGVVDMFQVVKALRVQKPGAVRTMVCKLTCMQYRLIFDAVLVFLDSFDTYRKHCGMLKSFRSRTLSMYDFDLK